MNKIIAGILIYVMTMGQVFGQATLLPNAKQTFVGTTGAPLAGGTVTSYVPNTTNKKTTWSDSAQTSNNPNPIILDAAGRAVIFGQGNYRQVVKDANGNTIWDAYTSAAGSSQPSGATGTDTAPVGTVMPFSGFVVPTNWALAYGQTLDRTTYAGLFTAITISENIISCTASSTTLSGWASTAQMRVGAPIEASCLSVGTTVASIVNASTITVSAAAISSITTTATVFPWGNGNGVNTFNVPDLRGRVFAGADAMGGTAASRLTSTYYGASASPPGVAGGSQSHVLTAAESAPLAFTTTTSIGASTVQSALGAGAVGNQPNQGANSNGTGTPSTNSVTFGTITSTTTSNAGGAAHSIVQPTVTVNYIIKIKSNSTGAGGVVSIGGMFGDIACDATFLCAPIGTTNYIGLATQLTGTVLANVSGADAQPTPTTFTAWMDDVCGSAQGDIVYRGASAWNCLTAGSTGDVLATQGPGANPIWTPAPTIVPQPANTVYAGPISGPDADPTFRSIVTADLSNSVQSALSVTTNAIPKGTGAFGFDSSGVSLSVTNVMTGLTGIGTKITLDASGNFTRLQTDMTSSDWSTWGGNAPYYFAISESWSPGVGTFSIPFLVQETMTGGNGSRQTFAAHFSTTGAAGVGGEFYQGADFVAANYGTGSGNYFGIGVYGIAGPTAAATTQIASAEFDTKVQTTVARKVGVYIVDIDGSTGSSSDTSWDTGLSINAGGTAVGFFNAIRIEDAGIKTGGNAFVSPGVTINKAGAITSTDLTVSRSAIGSSVNLAVTNTGIGYAGIEFTGDGTKWLESKRLAGDGHVLQWYYNAGSYALKATLDTSGNYTVTGGLTALGLTANSGTITASAPALNATQTWNNAGVTFSGISLAVTDTASAALSMLMDLKVGGTTKAGFSKSGTGMITGNLYFDGTTGAAQIVGSSTVFDMLMTQYWARFDKTNANIRVQSGVGFAWSSSATDARTAYDTILSRNAAGVVQIGTTAQNALGSLLLANLTASGIVQSDQITIGPTALTVTDGALGLNKITASASAPGAAGGKIELVCGTNAGTAKLIAYAGTSTTATTVLDNIGAGVTGC